MRRAFLALLLLAGCEREPSPQEVVRQAGAQVPRSADPLEHACEASATFAEIKRQLFAAAKARAPKSPQLDRLESSSVVRMEATKTVSRDDPLTEVQCGGRYILELPPGVTPAFGGAQRLTADISYAVKRGEAASAFSYTVEEIGPIVDRLADYGVAKPLPYAPLDAAAAASLTPPGGPAASASAPPPAPDCNGLSSRLERMICADPRLADLDRRMARTYDDVLAHADWRTRRLVRRTNRDFLDYVEGCPDAACVADAYRDRLSELRDYPVDE